jgi:hypothetical protein
VSPLTATMAALEPGATAWLETTLDDYPALMRRVTTRSRYHRSIRDRVFSTRLYVAVHGAEVVYLVRVMRL